MEAIVRVREARRPALATIPITGPLSAPQKTGNEGLTPKSESVGDALRPILFIGQFLAIPGHKERFAWKNWKTVSGLFWMACGTFFSIMTIVKEISETFTYTTIGDVSFYCLTVVYMGLFLRLSTEWPSLMEEWAEMEKSMEGLPVVRCSRKIAFVTASVFCYALWEHLLCLLHEVHKANQCTNYIFVETFYISYFKMIFMYIGYSVWLAAILSIINFILTITWNFTDIFIICMCISLAARFEQLYASLKRIIGKSYQGEQVSQYGLPTGEAHSRMAPEGEQWRIFRIIDPWYLHLGVDMPEQFWRESRERYVKLSLLTKNLDEKISLLLLVSFANNLYSICFMLYKSIKYRDVTAIQMTYYCSSLGLVCFRLFGICFAAGRIHDLSKDILPVLYSVPSQSYNIEVHRLFLQICQDPISLTGSRFFDVTRSLVLKITGTIFTYEIVLVQFNDINSEADKVKDEIFCG